MQFDFGILFYRVINLRFAYSFQHQPISASNPLTNKNVIDIGLIVAASVTAWDPVTDAATIKAADVNGDGNVNGLDAGILVDVENYMRTIDQSMIGDLTIKDKC